MEQTDNLDKSPDVLDSVTGQSDNQINDPGDFFSELDNQVNGLVVNSDNQQSQQITSKDLKARSTSPVAEVSNPDELKTLEKRYADSSREAKRLNNRLKELETYAPLLDRI